ncbi:MAG: hypothetical protein VB031_02225 [Eubacteriaceae bacterium]|nr:hypothetical protein [Eubacteriaceae bacterium]
MEMNAYQRLVARVKTSAEDGKTLHRHLIGPDWFQTHEQLGEYYGKLDDMSDHLTEIGLSQNIADVPIDAACGAFPLIPIKDRVKAESYEIIADEFLQISEAMDEVIEEIDEGWVISMLNNYQEWLHLEAEFKIDRTLR